MDLSAPYMGRTLNLLSLHVSTQDNNPQRLIKAECSTPLYLELNGMWNYLIDQQIDPIKKICRELNFKIDAPVVEEWFTERVDVPLVGIRYLLELFQRVNELSQSRIKNVLEKITRLRVCSGTSEIVWVPTNLCDDLLYFVGVIAGDGCLSSDTYRIRLEKTNEGYMRGVFKPLMERLFKIHVNLGKRERKGKKPTMVLEKKCKPLYRLLDIIFEVPKGKKAQKIRMPAIVQKLDPIDRVPYLTGLFDTDWGRYGGSFGTSTASKYLFKDMEKTLNELGIGNWRSRYKYRGHKSYHLRITPRFLPKLREILEERYPLKNPNRVIRRISP